VVSLACRELVRWRRQLEELPTAMLLRTESLVVDAAPIGYEREHRSLSGGSWFQRGWQCRVDAPPGTQMIVASSRGGVIRWSRNRNRFDGGALSVHASEWYDGTLHLDCGARREGRVEPPSPWLRSTPSLPPPRWCGGTAGWTTGRWLPVATSADGSEVGMVLLLSRADTRSLRARRWRIRAEVQALLPMSPFAALTRGFRGEIVVSS